jgi:hypothetical protein
MTIQRQSRAEPPLNLRRLTPRLTAFETVNRSGLWGQIKDRFAWAVDTTEFPECLKPHNIARTSFTQVCFQWARPSRSPFSIAFRFVSLRFV